MALLYRVRPSDLVGLEDPLLRYYFDRGLRIFGVTVQNRVDDAGHAAGRGAKNNRNREALQNGARKRTLAKLLGEDMVSSSAGFRDPAKAV
ncbi:tail assembly chaperone [Mycobacterium phage Nova]|uniref:Tail assembly chaperone n=1 Tax=Mycobacterium phage Nova TaxID=1089130 RepID=G8IAN5_9CAUD|nr:tail assembly chaperone [Mycobacterium phage Nova]